MKTKLGTKVIEDFCNVFTDSTRNISFGCVNGVLICSGLWFRGVYAKQCFELEIVRRKKLIEDMEKFVELADKTNAWENFVRRGEE